LRLEIPVSPGELLDKITILEIKYQQLTSAAQRLNVKHECIILEEVQRVNELDRDWLLGKQDELRAVNEKLWFVEERIRQLENDNQFDLRFIEQAREIIRLNGERSALKKEINVEMGSTFTEEKSY